MKIGCQIRSLLWRMPIVFLDQVVEEQHYKHVQNHDKTRLMKKKQPLGKKINRGAGGITDLLHVKGCHFLSPWQSQFLG